MASVQQTPQKMDVSTSQGKSLSKEQLRRDRINLAIVIGVFAVLIALMIWLASLGPPPGDIQFTYPLVP